MVIRHAEKPYVDQDGKNLGVRMDGSRSAESLAVRGWQRAGALSLLVGFPEIAQSRGLSVPDHPVEWLAAHPELPGPLWNDFSFGSYLAFALPSRPTWLDSRFFVFPPRQMEEYQKVSHGLPEWRSLLRRDGINLLRLSTAAQAKLIEGVQSSGEWYEEYRDEDAVIFSRCEPIQ